MSPHRRAERSGAVIRLMGARAPGSCASAGQVRAATLGMLAITLVAGCGSAPGDRSPTSWNPHLTTRPVRATIADILRTDTNSLGGATRSGGWHSGTALADLRRYVGHRQNGGVDQRRLVPPPATVNSIPVFVEIDDVEVSWSYDNGDVPGTDHDTSGNACTVGRPRSNLTCIHIEIDGQWDGQWKDKGWAPANFQLNTPIDIQGYVFWDVPHREEGVPYDNAPSGSIRATVPPRGRSTRCPHGAGTRAEAASQAHRIVSDASADASADARQSCRARKATTRALTAIAVRRPCQPSRGPCLARQRQASASFIEADAAVCAVSFGLPLRTLLFATAAIHPGHGFPHYTKPLSLVHLM